MPSPLRSASLTAPGESRPEEKSPSDLRLVGAVLHDHAIEPLVSVDEIGLAVAGQIGHRKRHGLVGLVVGAERAVAVTLQDEQITIDVADQEIGYSVFIDVGYRQAGRLGACVIGHGLGETFAAVAEVDAHCLTGDDGQIRDLIAIEVGHANDLDRVPGR